MLSSGSCPAAPGSDEAVGEEMSGASDGVFVRAAKGVEVLTRYAIASLWFRIMMRSAFGVAGRGRALQQEPLGSASV